MLQKTGTITPLNPYTNDFIKEDVEELHHALHKKKLDADVIKDILTSRSLKQRLIIDQNYNKTYNEVLIIYTIFVLYNIFCKKVIYDDKKILKYKLRSTVKVPGQFESNHDEPFL